MLFVYLCIIYLFIYLYSFIFLSDNLQSAADTRKAKQGHSFAGTFSWCSEGGELILTELCVRMAERSKALCSGRTLHLLARVRIPLLTVLVNKLNFQKIFTRQLPFIQHSKAILKFCFSLFQYDVVFFFNFHMRVTLEEEIYPRMRTLFSFSIFRLWQSDAAKTVWLILFAMYWWTSSGKLQQNIFLHFKPRSLSQCPKKP